MNEQESIERGWLTSQAAFFADKALVCEGRSFVPDRFRAFLACSFAHSLPVTTTYGTGMLASVVARSYEAMRCQAVNIEHMMKAWDPENVKNDRVIGAVQAVEFPSMPEGGWIIPAERKDAPGARAVCSIAKFADGVQEILKGYSSGTQEWAVSMEVVYNLLSTAFAWDADKKDIELKCDVVTLSGGWKAVRYGDAPSEMRDCWGGTNPRRILRPYQGANLTLLMGGLDGTVEFSGLGVVRRGAEPEAQIERLTASADGAAVQRVTDAIKDFADILGRLASF